MDPVTSTQPRLLCSGCTLAGECWTVWGVTLSSWLVPLHEAALCSLTLATAGVVGHWLFLLPAFS